MVEDTGEGTSGGSTHEVDVVVIGGGPVGENVADRVVKGGLTAAVVESQLLGGECSYYACVPSKGLLRPGSALEGARTVDGARQAVTGALDVESALARRTRLTHDWTDDGQADWLAEANVDLARGHGRLAGKRSVAVDLAEGGTVTIGAEHAVVIATGTTPLLPSIPGLAEAEPWTNHEATSADAAPRRLIVLGGGPVACELATAWRSLGSEEVTVVERGPRLLRRVEPFAAEAVEAGLEAQGVVVWTGASATRVERPLPGGAVRLHLDGGEGDPVVEADELLVATGRTPASWGIGLETVGLAPGSWLDVDDTGRVTGVDGGWLYAAGDITREVLLTHVGKYQARACGDAIVARALGKLREDAGDAPPWGPFAATSRHRAVPQVIYTRPEVAAVGLTEAAARDSGIDVRVVRHAIDVSGATLHADDYEGSAQIVVDEARGVIVGATFVGPDVGELLHAATIAVVCEVPLDRLWHAVPAFPSVSEIWLRLLEAYGL
jgi:pyruvate/2-oxoglutarate dehydrogenase complex dihydrolipoamide dehydrogenase (E3) component